jgi:hypothetical protein
MPTALAALLLLTLAAGEPPGDETGLHTEEHQISDGEEAAAPLRVPSLLGAETLRGSSAALAWAGYRSLGAAYGQGIGARDDLGLTLDLDWTSTELVLGAFWRRHMGRAGSWDLAGRLAVGWYADLGATWLRRDNQGDRGLALSPALILSPRAGPGIVTVAGEVPLTVTFWRSGGLVMAPRFTLGFEAPLYDELSLGVRGGLAWRGASGGAPMTSGRTDAELLVLVGYRVF